MRLLTFLLCLLAGPALAHNVVGGVYAIGTEIEGEAGFSNGDSAKPGLLVEVFDSNENLLGKTETDAEGMFTFIATARIEHHFRIEMGSGHVLQVSLPADELPEDLPGGGTPAAVVAKAASLGNTAIDAGQLQAVVEKAVARQVAPLRKELAAFKEKAGLRDIIGGIGYIFGLCGLVIILRERKQRKAAAQRTGEAA